MHEFKERVNFIDLTRMDVPQLTDRLAKLPAHTIILYLAYYKKPNGTFLAVSESTSLALKHSGRPAYSMWEHTLGNGIVGGMMISGDVQGRKAAEYALKILKGIDKCKAGKVAEYDYKLEVAGERKTFCKDPNGHSLIIADQIMPSMTGLQLSKEISKCRSDIPIILCSGVLDEHSVEVSTELL
jgi:CheY-like chemotaxis protein